MLAHFSGSPLLVHILLRSCASYRVIPPLMMQAPDLGRTDAASFVASSPTKDNRPFSSRFRLIIAEVADLPHLQENLLCGFDAHELHSERQLTRPPFSASEARTWPDVLADWLVHNKKISETKRLAYASLVAAVIEKCNAAEIPITGRKRSLETPSDSTSTTVNGRRFSGIKRLNPAHPKFWEYLAVAAKLSLQKGRSSTYICACGSSESAVQAYNFIRHLKTCAPGLYLEAPSNVLPTPPSPAVCVLCETL